MIRRGHVGFSCGALTVSLLLFWTLVSCHADGASPAPQRVSDRLWQVAQDIAHDAHTHVVAAEAVKTTRRAAVDLAAGRAIGADADKGRRLWLVSITSDGPFDCECTVRPSSTGKIDPRFMLTLVEPGTYDWGFWGDLRSELIDLSALGTPRPLHG